MVAQYYSGNIFAYLSAAKEGELKIYIEYISKKNILKPMIVFAETVYEDHVIVRDVVDSFKIKRLNFDGIFRIGLELRNV